MERRLCVTILLKSTKWSQGCVRNKGGGIAH
nr:MAG TPA_asm: hypothetical protein [Bacteriophage sp.]